MCRGEEGEEVKKREVEEEGKKEIAAGVKGADGRRFLPTLDSSPACARMAALPGTVPRMMRPAPGQNYPRTGFPLEGKSAWARRASAPPPGTRGPGRGSDPQGGGGASGSGRGGGGAPSLLGTESGRWTPGSFQGPTPVRFCAAFSDPRPRLHRSRALAFPRRANSRPLSAPSKFRVLANFSSFPLFSDTFPADTFSALCVRRLQRFLLSFRTVPFFTPRMVLQSLLFRNTSDVGEFICLN